MEADGAATSASGENRNGARARSPARANKRGEVRVTGVPVEVPRLVPVIRTHRCCDGKMRRLQARTSSVTWRMEGRLSSSSLQQWENSLSLSLSHTPIMLCRTHGGDIWVHVSLSRPAPADNGALPNDSRIKPDVVVGTRRSFSSSDENQSVLVTCKGAENALKRGAHRRSGVGGMNG